MKNNKGFTLVELIVVIALMGIIAGVSTYTIRTISKQELKDFANGLDAMLSQCKVETMSGMNNPVLTIERENGEYKATLTKNVRYGNYTSTEDVKSQYLGKTSLNVTYVYYINRVRFEVPIERFGNLSFRYDRSTGEMTAMMGNMPFSISELVVKDEKGTAYTIEFVPETGYHKVVR